MPSGVRSCADSGFPGRRATRSPAGARPPMPSIHLCRRHPPCRTAITTSDVPATVSAIAVVPSTAVRGGSAHGVDGTLPIPAAASARSVSRNAGPPIGSAPGNVRRPASSASGIRRPAGTNTGARAGVPRHASRGTTAPGAAGIRASRTGDFARIAANASAAGTASDTPGLGPRVGSMAAKASAPSEGRPGAGAARARPIAAGLRAAFVAAFTRPWKADRAASRAWIRAGSPTGQRMPGARPPGCAPGARRQLSTGRRCAGPAR